MKPTDILKGAKVVKLSALAGKARNALGPVGVKLSKHAPAIFTGVGILGMVGGTILACMATRKVVEFANDCDVERAIINQILDDPSCDISPYKHDEFTAEDSIEMHDELKEIDREFIKYTAKSYLPVVIVDGLSIASILFGSHISHKRLITMTGIAASSAAQLAEYRARVKELEGADADQRFLKGEIETEIEEKKETKTGKERTVKKKIRIPNPDEHGEYAFQFKPGDAGWSYNPEYNLYYLQAAEKKLNRHFKQQGYLFLNQVYDELGIREDGKWKWTQEGQVIGWFDDETEEKSISFGIDYTVPAYGYADYIWIEPNLDGIIIDKI